MYWNFSKVKGGAGLFSKYCSGAHSFKKAEKKTPLLPGLNMTLVAGLNMTLVAGLNMTLVSCLISFRCKRKCCGDIKAAKEQIH